VPARGHGLRRYFRLLAGFRCDRSLAALLFTDLGVLELCSKLPAFEASFLIVPTLRSQLLPEQLLPLLGYLLLAMLGTSWTRVNPQRWRLSADVDRVLKPWAGSAGFWQLCSSKISEQSEPPRVRIAPRSTLQPPATSRRVGAELGI
jgi:hypothetical protein